MLIGRSDDPQNPCRVVAFKVSVPFGSGSRNPSGPAAPTAQTGRTHDRNRTRSGFSLSHPLRQRGRPHTPYALLFRLGVDRETHLGQRRVLRQQAGHTTATAPDQDSRLTPCTNSAVHTRHKKLRYRGLAKNTAQLHTLFALANLVIVKKALLA